MFSPKISRRSKVGAAAMVAAVGVLAFGSQWTGGADAAIDPFVPFAALSNPELAELRGGFNFNGLDLDIAINIDVSLKSLVNGVGLISVLVFNNDGEVESASTDFLPGPTAGDEQTDVVADLTGDEGVATKVTTETTTIIHELTTKTFKSIIETSGNSQTITNAATFNISISETLQAAVDSFSKTILPNSIATQIGLSSLGRF